MRRRYRYIAAALLAAAPVLKAGERPIIIEPSQRGGIPNCSMALAPGTLCRWVPFSSITFELHGDNVDKTLPFTCMLPKGFRSVSGMATVEIAPSGDACAPEASEFYEGSGAVSVSCWILP